MSYVHFDDKHEHGRLTEFCERFGGEVRMQTGEEFHIFQDRKDIAWGQQWRQRIDDSLDTTTFLVPIITPSFFKSQACQKEFDQFLEREKRLKRDDLILPVYYVECSVLSNEAKRLTNPQAEVIAARQFTDWRELRFEPLTSPEVGKTLARMAKQLVEALERRTPLSPSAPRKKPSHPRPEKSKKHPAPVESTSESRSKDPAGLGAGPTQKKDPPIRVVDALHRGDHATLSAALEAAEPGDRILVRPGLYQEGIVIEKPVEILGDGELGEVIIQAAGRHVILFRANMGRIANLTLRQIGRENGCGVNITQGRLEMEGCDISSQGLACVAIHDGADPRLRRNRIHDGKEGGVIVYAGGIGTLEDNEIFGNAKAGVEIKDGNPTLRRNRIHDGKTGGILVYARGTGTLEDNEIFGNGYAGVEIKDGGNPTLRRNRIYSGKQSGVMVSVNGIGTLEDNEIFGNGYAGVEIRGGGNPTLRRNRISENAYQAVWVYDGGQGIIEDNDLRGNKHGPWFINPGCVDKVKRARNQEA